MGDEIAIEGRPAASGISRRGLLTSGAAVAAAGLAPEALVSAALAQAATGGRPNIVFVLADNVGWGDFSCYGGSIPTPRIDKLASEGIRFNNYTIESQCTPTRTAIITGRQSVRCGTYTVVPGTGQARLDALGIRDRQAAFRRRLRDFVLGQVAPRRHRGPAADRPGLRRMVGLPQLRRRGRLRLLRGVPRGGEGQRGRTAQAMGRQEGGEARRDRRSRLEGAPAARRDDRRQGQRLHQARRQGRQAVLRLCRPLACASAGEGASRLRPDRSDAPGDVCGPHRGNGPSRRPDRRLRGSGRHCREHALRVLERQRGAVRSLLRFRRFERTLARRLLHAPDRGVHAGAGDGALAGQGSRRGRHRGDAVGARLVQDLRGACGRIGQGADRPADGRRRRLQVPARPERAHRAAMRCCSSGRTGR